jgi:hypothetical protein
MTTSASGNAAQVISSHQRSCIQAMSAAAANGASAKSAISLRAKVSPKRTTSVRLLLRRSLSTSRRLLMTSSTVASAPAANPATSAACVSCSECA